MPNEQITLIVAPMSIKVELGKAKGSRIMWCAPGLEIFVRGRVAENYDTVRHQAVSECVARHIPALNLKLAPERMPDKKPVSINPNQKELL